MQILLFLQWFRISAGGPHASSIPGQPDLIWVHAVSDLLIAPAYFTIPISLLRFFFKSKDPALRWMFHLLTFFVVACGASRILEVWNVWHDDYWVSAFTVALAATASIPTAIVLTRILPQALEAPSTREWIAANADLKREVEIRRDLELDLRTREAAYREQAELLDLIHDAVFVRTFEGRILYWNKGAERMYGWTSEEARGSTSHDLLQTVFPMPLEEIIDQVLSRHRWEGELIHTRRDSARCTVSSRWVLRNEVGSGSPSLLEINRDITQNKQEEQKFRSLLESAPDAMVIVNSAGLIHLVNAQTEKLFGYSREELIGRAVETLVPDRFHSNHVRYRANYSVSPRTRAMGADLTLFGRRKDGSEFPVEVSLSPLETAEDVLISSAIRDVTERRRIQEQLAQVNDTLELRVQERTRELLAANEDVLHSHERLELAQKVASIGIFDYDLQAECGAWSPGMFEIYGLPFSSESITREFWQSRMLSESIAITNREFDKQVATTGDINLEFQIRRPDGQIRWIASRGKLFPNSSGEKVRLVGVNADITESKNREEEVRMQKIVLERRVEERTAELQLANKELESFSYSVSHDLRAPLRHMDGFARILKEEFSAALPPDGARYLDRIIHAANQMGCLVDDLLALSRIGRTEVLRTRVNLADIVNEVRKDVSADAEGRSVEWKIGSLPDVDCDPGLLKIVFSNLISNALKFTRPRPIACIEVGICTDSEQPEIFIRDNGVGFDSKYADKLFGVFQRLHREEEFEGTGIGLATVQRIIHRHGGEIRASSQPGVGTSFFFTLGKNSLVGSTGESPEVHVDRT